MFVFVFWWLSAFGGFWFLVDFGSWRLLAFGGFWFVVAFGSWWLLAFGGLWRLRLALAFRGLGFVSVARNVIYSRYIKL